MTFSEFFKDGNPGSFIVFGLALAFAAFVAILVVSKDQKPTP